MQCSIDVDYINYILTYQDTRLVPKCYAFHLVVALTGLPIGCNVISSSSNRSP